MGDITYEQAVEIAREIFVGEPDESFLEYLIWNETPWPFTRDEDDIRTMLQVYHDDPKGVLAARRNEEERMMREGPVVVTPLYTVVRTESFLRDLERIKRGLR